MKLDSSEAEPLWRQCELRWAEWLIQRGYHVEPLADVEGNVTQTRAPMVRSRSGIVRAPDILTVSPDGRAEFWEVKFRSRPDVDESTGEPIYWVSDAALSDYLRVADRAPFWIVLYEAPNAHHDGRWLQASAHAVKEGGRRDERYGRGGQLLEAWVWPASIMTIVDGPAVGAPRVDEPLVVNEGDTDWVGNAEIIEAGRRQWQAAAAAPSSPADMLVRSDVRLSLEATALQLGLKSVPQYSVTRIGALSPGDTSALLAMIEHGLRVYVIAEGDPTTPLSSPRIEAWKAARLLEVAVVPRPIGLQTWIIDGQTVHEPCETAAALAVADQTSTFNLGQYEIIHSDPRENTAVLAGAGTGKTETMTERMVFLLATSSSRGRVGQAHQGALRASELAFITFTREAAAEMRARLSRTLLLRQRLCSRPLQPFRQWSSELTTTRVSTIHSFAQGIIAELGAEAGYGSTLRVRSLLMPFRRLIQEALSPHLPSIYRDWRNAPAEYEWQKHVEAIWKALEDRAPISSLHGAPPVYVNLGLPHGDEANQLAVRVTNDVLNSLAVGFAQLCRDEDVVPVSQLIPLAVAILRETPSNSVPGLRYVFVDEFQDTDAEQISLLTELIRTTGCRSFLVGDLKQGIYRFRGAAGNAFSQVTGDFEASGQTLQHHSLLKNFRSTPTLLSHMDGYFSGWRDAGVLDYDHALTPMRPRATGQPGIVLRRSGSEASAAAEAARQVEAWQGADQRASIGILCRDNRQASLMKDALAARKIDCVTYTGGQFFRTPAVREFRSLLEAINDPSNDAALLELLQSSWGGGIVATDAPTPLGLTQSERSDWTAAPVSVTDWSTRVREFTDGSFDLSDLSPVRTRIFIINALTRRTSSLNVITSLLAAFRPSGLATAISTTEQQRYIRCLNHLVTILVDQFEGGSATLPSMLEWLRIKIVTDTTEDEPVDPEMVQGDRACVALTVHKAKGLQYQRVIIPFTNDKFLRNTGEGKTSASVVDHDDEVRLLWRWNASGVNLANFIPSAPAAYVDAAETIREETRLLYVAMTRAQDELVVLTGVPSSGTTIQRWNDLLDSRVLA